MSKVSWLHISDMHISRPGGDHPISESCNQEEVLQAFLNYVKDQLPKELERIEIEQPSLVFFTGDLAFAGSKQNYDGPETGSSSTNSVKEFLRELGKNLNIPAAERIFLVAGNHDVCRDSAFLGHKFHETANLDLVKNPKELNELLLSDFEPYVSTRKQILKRLGPYCDFYREFKGLSAETSPEDILWYKESVTLSTDSDPVHVIGLCSSWLCHSHWLVNQKGKAVESDEEPIAHLPLGELKTKLLLDKIPDGELCIALMHHDCDAIKAEDALEHIHGKCHLVLSGHAHDNKIWASPLEGISHKVQAGSLYEQKNHRNAFNLVELDLDSDCKTVKMVTVEYHPKNGWQIDRGANPVKKHSSQGYDFDPDTGVLTFPLKRDEAASGINPVEPHSSESEPAKKYFGKSRSDNLNWLAGKWLTAGPPVCFLEGFPGVGKSALASELLSRVKRDKSVGHAFSYDVPETSSPSTIDVLMQLSEDLSQQGFSEMENVLLGQENPNLGQAMEMALKSPILIVLDEFQYFFEADSGKPLREWNAILEHLRNRPDLPGRLLLLSDRMVERSRWSDTFTIRTLNKLEPEEAIAALDDKLKFAGVTSDIADKVKQDLVQALDYNPRAFQALAVALTFDSLDEIIGQHPGFWDVKDREISREFLDRLERELLQRTMAHLPDLHRQRLIKLAVHRKGFKKPALRAVCASNSEEIEVRTTLITRFLLDHYPGSRFFKVNPIVREISLARLGDSPSDSQKAHSDAADYHLGPFKAKRMLGSSVTLGVSFAELHYHLFHAHRTADLRDACQRFADHLKLEIKSISPVPNNREELDQRIGILSALLKDEGAKGLEYHLARCLHHRRNPEDLKQAVIHATRAAKPHGPAESWRLLVELEAVVDGVDVALRTVQKAIKVIPPTANLFVLYKLGADLLTGAKRNTEAVALLREGIKVPGMTSLFSLYQSCAEILSRDEKPEDAVALLREGIKVPGMTSLSSLYQSCAEILSGDGQSAEAVALLRAGIKVPGMTSLFSLYLSCAEILSRDGQTEDAVALLREGIKVIPPQGNLFSLYLSCAKILSGDGQTAKAVTLLREGIKVISERQNRYKLVEAVFFICLASGKGDLIDQLISAGSGLPISRQQILLGNALKCQDKGDWLGAAETAKAARAEFPSYFTLAWQEIWSRLGAADPKGATAALSQFSNFVFSTGASSTWLAAFAHLRCGADDEARNLLALYLGKPLADVELSESFLLRLWDEQEAEFDSSILCFHYPILPLFLSGLKEDVRRIQGSPPVLPCGVGTTEGETRPRSDETE